MKNQMKSLNHSSAQKIIERPTPSTIRVDGSDLITRCKDFLPLLANPIEKLSEEEAKELDIPEILSDKSSKESGEASSTTEDDEEKKNEEIVKKKRKKKKKKKKKKVKTDDNPPVNIEK